MAKFWWVNQGQSYGWERDLGILWAPKKTAAGKKEHHWERMNHVQPGDLVLHYAGGQIRAVSSVLVHARDAVNPHSGRTASDWNKEGREISVRVHELNIPLPLRAIPVAVRQGWKGYGQPFDRNGNVVVGYLFQLPTNAAVWLMKELGLEAAADDVFFDQEMMGKQGYYGPAIVVGADGEVAVKVRAEQHQLRQHLFGRETEQTCALCGRTLPANLMVTAHIKQRSQCTANERIDRNVVMAACALGCDAVFEKGYVHVSKHGIIDAGPIFEGGEHLQGFIDYLVGRKVTVYSPVTEKYFAWHAGWHRKRNQIKNGAAKNVRAGT